MVSLLIFDDKKSKALLNLSMQLSFAYIQRAVLVYVLKMASLEIYTANQQRQSVT